MRAICTTRHVERELGPFAWTETATPNWALLTGTVTPGSGMPEPGSVFHEWPSEARHLRLPFCCKSAVLSSRVGSYFAGVRVRCERGLERSP